MTRRFVQINGELVEYGSHIPERIAPDVMPDIKPYQSMVTGEEIKSRSHHRAHLRQHGLREIGNDTAPLLRAYDKLPDVAPQQRKELIRSQIDAMSESQFRRAIKRDIDRVKWNSRSD